MATASEGVLLLRASASRKHFLTTDLLKDLHSVQTIIDNMLPFINLKPFSATSPSAGSDSFSPFTPASPSPSQSSTNNSGPIRETRGFIKSSLHKRIKKPAKLSIPDESRIATFAKANLFKSISEDSDLHRNTNCDGSSRSFFGLASKKGRKDVMEDAYTARVNLNQDKDPSMDKYKEMQAFFAVFDGHGGREAATFAAEKLVENVAMAMEKESTVEEAMVAGYANTDAEFLAKNLKSGACSVSALVTKGHLVVANAGDCKAVLCRNGKAEALTTVHRGSNKEERRRIEELGGFVDCFNGVWRLQGTLAVTRGFGDKNLKQWVSIKPEVKKLKLTRDCEFLILASDGLWDMMNDQEVVDCAREELLGSELLMKQTQDLFPSSIGNRTKQCHTQSLFGEQNEDNSKLNACNMLIQKACSRGNLDDITIMLVPLQSFITYEAM